MRKQLVAWAAILLAPLFFVLHEWQRHFGPVRPRNVFEGWAILTGASVVFTALLWLLARRRLSVAAGGTLIAFLPFCFWGYFYERVTDLWAPKPPPVTPLLVVVLFIVCVLVWWRFTRIAETGRQKLLRFAALLFAVLAAVDGIQVARGYTDAQHDFSPLPAAARPPQDWNFYLLLFDELASPEAMRSIGHDPGALESFLHGQGFHVVENPRSNYNKTVFSMSSMLNADFVPGRRNGQEVDPEEYSQCLRWINESKLPAEFARNGYGITNLSIFELHDQAPLVGEPFFRSGTDLLLSSTFYGRVLRKKIIERKAARPWMHDPHFYALRYQDSTLRRLTELPRRKKHFVYAHFLTPHRPFYFDSSGRVMSKEDTYWASLGDEPVYYRASIRHAENVIRRAVNEVMQKEQGQAVVMVIGDHGYRKSEYPGADPVSFQGFAAVYFPDKDYRALTPGTTHINTMRTAAGKTLGIPFNRLPDTCVVLGRNGGRPNIKL